MEVAALFLSVVVMLLIGVPIAVSLGLSSILFLLVLSDTSLASIVVFFQVGGIYFVIPFLFSVVIHVNWRCGKADN